MFSSPAHAHDMTNFSNSSISSRYFSNDLCQKLQTTPVTVPLWRFRAHFGTPRSTSIALGLNSLALLISHRPLGVTSSPLKSLRTRRLTASVACLSSTFSSQTFKFLGLLYFLASFPLTHHLDQIPFAFCLQNPGWSDARGRKKNHKPPITEQRGLLSQCVYGCACSGRAQGLLFRGPAQTCRLHSGQHLRHSSPSSLLPAQEDDNSTSCFTDCHHQQWI